MEKALSFILLTICTLSMKAQTTPKQVVENYVNLLNEWQRSPDNTEKRKKVLAMFQTEGDGCGMKDEIVEKYYERKSNCIPDEYMRILYDEGSKKHIKVEIVGKLTDNSDKYGTIITAVLRYSGGISFTTVSDFWISGNKITGIVSNEREITKLNIDKVIYSNPPIQHEEPKNEIVAINSVNQSTTIYKYVDLGLPSGTLWATCNVGANNPWEYGDYFAWGETKPKKNYTRSSYKFFAKKYYYLTKYCDNYSFGHGFIDNISILERIDDAATANMGAYWRMPTQEEWLELYNNCNWEWTDNYKHSGIAGRIASSKKDPEQSVFFPCGGLKAGEETDNQLVGYYWTSTLDKNFYAFACNFWEVTSYYRDYGMLIRAVWQNRSADFGNVLNDNKRIRGYIYDKFNNPLAGVYIVEKGTKNGTVTDLDGKFELSIQASPVIVVSCPGYKTEKITYNFDKIILKGK